MSSAFLKKKVFIESLDGRPQHNRVASSIGFKALSYNVEFVDTDTILRKSEEKEQGVYHGRMRTQRQVWKNLGITDPQLPYYPDHLKPLLKRNIHESTVGEIKQRPNEKVFMKPHWTNRKQFIGGVFYTQGMHIDTIPDDVKVWVDTPTTFLSEWRLYVRACSIKAVGCYSGCLKVYPPMDDIERLLQTSKAPSAYCVDVGFNLDTKEWQLIEVNEVLYAGTYGIHPDEYARMVEARWAELTGKPVQYFDSITIC